MGDVMAWSVTNLENYCESVGMFPSKTTGSLSIPANSIILVFCHGSDGWNSGTASVSDSVDGTSGWIGLNTQVGLGTNPNDGGGRVFYKSFTSAVSRTITVSKTTNTFWGYDVVAVTGHDTSNPIVQSKIAGTQWSDSGGSHTQSVTLDNAPHSGNAVIWFMGVNNDSDGAATLPTGYTSLANPSTQFQATHAAYHTTTSTKTITSTDCGEGIQYAVAAAIEIRQALPSWMVNRTVLGDASTAANGTDKHTCTFTTATSGNYLVAVVAGAVTFTTPTGWTLLGSAVSNAGLYVFARTARGGESSFSTSHNGSDYAIQGVVYEFMAGTVFLDSASANTQAKNTPVTGPQVSGLTGTYTRFAARSYNQPAANTTFSVAWTLPTVEDYDVSMPYNGVTDGAGLSIAYDHNSTGASFNPSSTLTTANNSGTIGEGVSWALRIKTTRETPIAEYSFDTIGAPGTSLAVSGTIPDLSGNGNTLVVQNAAMDIVNGNVRGRGVKGDGSTRAQVASASAIKPTTAVTWMCWMRRTGTFNWGQLFGRCNDDTSWGDAFSFYCDQSNNDAVLVVLQLDSAGSAVHHSRDQDQNNELILQLNSWTHMAATWSSATHLLKIYKNGIEIDSTATSSDNTIFYGSGGNTTNHFNIFYNEHYGEIGNNIEIDDVRVFNVALTEGEVKYYMDTLADNKSGGVWFVSA